MRASASEDSVDCLRSFLPCSDWRWLDQRIDGLSGEIEALAQGSGRSRGSR